MNMKSRFVILGMLASMILTSLSGCCCVSMPASTEPTAPIVYEDISVHKIFSEYRENKVRAKDTFVGRCASFSGTIGKIEDDYILVVLDYSRPDDIIPRQYDVFCDLKNKGSLNETIMALNKGDIVIVNGEIKGLYETEISIYLHAVEAVSN